MKNGNYGINMGQINLSSSKLLPRDNEFGYSGLPETDQIIKKLKLFTQMLFQIFSELTLHLQ